jgi:hypothetical protein
LENEIIGLPCLLRVAAVAVIIIIIIIVVVFFAVAFLFLFLFVLFFCVFGLFPQEHIGG